VVKEKPTCVSPLGLVEKTLPDNSKKYRLVWDASRHVNKFVQTPHVRLAHLEKALELSEKDDHQIIFDLASAYYHIKIDETQHKFLGASITNSDSSVLYFQYTHLPFGLSSAVHAITKLWKPIGQFLNQKGIRNSIYIDDGRILVKKMEEVEQTREFVYNTVAAAGWAVEKSKSDMEGQAGKIKKYLGFVINTSDMIVSATEEKLQKIKMCIDACFASDLIKVKLLAKLLGLIISLEPSHDVLARVSTRSGYIDLAQHTETFGWKGSLQLSLETKEEIKFFEENMYKGNGSLIKTAQLDVRIENILPNPLATRDTMRNHAPCSDIYVSDASETKAVAYNLGNGSSLELQYNFTEEEKKWSSSARETLAVLKTLQQFKLKDQKNKNIYWITDSEVMTQVLKKGSHRPMLQNLVFQIAKLCNELKVRIEPIHLRREDPRIQLADEWSKTPDSDNWSVDDQSFKNLDNQFGFQVDLFADRQNRKVLTFFSQYFQEGSLGVDAFSYSWNDLGMCWVCPAVTDLIKTHKRIINSKAKGVLILPKWLTSSFIGKKFRENL